MHESSKENITKVDKVICERPKKEVAILGDIKLINGN